MHVAVDTPEAAVMHVADIVAVEADIMAAVTTVVDTVPTMVRLMGLAPAFQYRCPLLVAGKPAVRRLINVKIGPAFAASYVH
jgi:hypothetical protein